MKEILVDAKILRDFGDYKIYDIQGYYDISDASIEAINNVYSLYYKPQRTISMIGLFISYLDHDICAFFHIINRIRKIIKQLGYIDGYELLSVSQEGYLAVSHINSAVSKLFLPIKLSKKELNIMNGTHTFFINKYKDYKKDYISDNNEEEIKSFKDFCIEEIEYLLDLEIERSKKNPLFRLKNIFLFFKRYKREDYEFLWKFIS